MSVLQYGGCLNIFICQLCGNIICLYFNDNYTQPVWELISNTNQFIQNVQPTGGRTVPTYPYVCILKSRWRTSLAVSAMLTDHIRSSLFIKTTHRRAKTHSANMRPGVCEYAVACDCKLLHAVTTITEHLSLRHPSRPHLLIFSHLSSKENSCWDIYMDIYMYIYICM